MYKQFQKFKPIKKIIFALLIGFSVVSFWRGIWGVLDVYLFPNNYELSSWLSIVIGLLILGLTHTLTKELV